MPELQQDEMECPYCAEVIKKAAIVCKHCGRGLIGRNEPTLVTTEQIKVLTEKQKALEKAIQDRLQLGWILIGRTAEAAQMMAPKKFDWIVFITILVISMLTFGLPLFLYVIWWVVKRPKVIMVTVDEELHVLVDGRPEIQTSAPGGTLFSWSQSHNMLGQPSERAGIVAPGFQQVAAREQTPEEKAKAATSTRKALTILGALALAFILLVCGCSLLSAVLSNHNIPAAVLPSVALLV